MVIFGGLDEDEIYEQPDDGPLTSPKHVVVSYISLLSDILLCLLTVK